MKTSFFLTTFCLISLSAFVIFLKIAGNGGIMDSFYVSISDSEDNYQLAASFDASKTWKVQQYINRCIEPNGLFKSENDRFDVTTTLTDHTTFYIKESPGRIKIEIDKRKNSYSSYRRIKKMCDGIKDLLAGKGN